MPLFERSFSDLMQEALVDLTKQTRVTRVSPGSKARTLLEAASRNLNEAYRTFDLNFARAFLSGAQGRYLDFIGELLGVTRAGTEVAKASASSKTIKFFVEVNNFGSINNGGSFTVPAGTIISSVSDGKGVAYRTITPTVLLAGGTEVFVNAEAIIPGQFGNIGEGVLQFHDFTGYTDEANDSLKVTNVAGIFGGADVESDVNYRFRLSQQVLSAEAANETSVRIAALLTPGVADVLIIPFYKGVSSYRVLIKSITPTVSASLVDAVSAAITRVTAEGIISEASRPFESGMSFTITIRYRKKLSEEDMVAIEGAVSSALRDYIDSLDIGEEFVVNEAVQRVLDVSEEIKDIGKATKPFDEIFVYRETALQDNKIRNEVLENLTPRPFERLIIEPSLSVPIKILHAT